MMKDQFSVDGIVLNSREGPDHDLNRDRSHGYKTDGANRMEESTLDTFWTEE